MGRTTDIPYCHECLAGAAGLPEEIAGRRLSSLMDLESHSRCTEEMNFPYVEDGAVSTCAFYWGTSIMKIQLMEIAFRFSSVPFGHF